MRNLIHLRDVNFFRVILTLRFESLIHFQVFRKINFDLSFIFDAIIDTKVEPSLLVEYFESRSNFISTPKIENASQVDQN